MVYTMLLWERPARVQKLRLAELIFLTRFFLKTLCDIIFVKRLGNP